MSTFPKRLSFTKADLRLPMVMCKGRRNFISGVQAKVLLSMIDGELLLSLSDAPTGWRRMT